MPALKIAKVHKIGGSDMIALPKEWKGYWIEDSICEDCGSKLVIKKDDREEILYCKKCKEERKPEVLILSNSLSVIIPRNVKGYSKLKEKAKKIVES